MKHVVVTEDGWSVENRVLRDIHEGLKGLGTRRLEKREHQNRVTWLIRNRFEDPNQNIVDAINSIVDENPAPEGWEGADLPVAVNETRQREINKLMKERQTIAPIPEKALLRESDLPKFIKESIGDQNQFGVGEIMRLLHFVYPDGYEKPETVPDGKDGTSEQEG